MIWKMYIDQFWLWAFILEQFDNFMQQDAHEFLNELLNTVADVLQGELQW